MPSEHMSRYYHEMIYLMPEVVDGIYKVLIPTSHTYVVCYLNCCLIVYTYHGGMLNRES